MHNRRIAEALAISPRTVEVHKARVLEKTGVRNVVELIRLVGGH
jgi:DNA-binding CsgD family transcriptional regulator